MRLGELQPLKPPAQDPDDVEVEKAIARSRLHPSIFGEAELLSTLLARGQTEAARLVASGIDGEIPTTLSGLIGRLEYDEIPRIAPPLDVEESFNAAMFATELGSSARRRLSVRTNNAAAWVDLALAHTIQGLMTRAVREIRLALQLAPDNRFVLRAAARFFVHIDEPEQANRILRQSNRLAHDPWLLAAELSSAQKAFGRVQNVNRSRTMVEESGYSPRALSELISELATAEMHSGSDKRARSLFRQSFTDPTENAVAQAVSWSDRTNLELRPELLAMDGSYEARALENARSGDWSGATSEASSWHRDQPFSIDPYTFASYTASLGLGDFERASQIALEGLRLHKNDRTLRNNAAYSLANLDRTAEARLYVDVPARLNEVDDFVDLATMGMIHFREGDWKGGSTMYQRAIVGFNRHKRNDLTAVATAHWAIEEARLALPTAPALVKRANRLLLDVPAAERATLSLRIKGTTRVS